MSKQAMQAVMDYQWPGNIRELANAVEHAFVLCAGRQIEMEDLPLEIRNQNAGARDLTQLQPSSSPAVRRSGHQLTREHLVAILHAAGWNKAEAARQTGLSRASIWKYMKKWDIPMQPD
jgi:transcriptional regulator of acetoin/glycerol metabolism